MTIRTKDGFCPQCGAILPLPVDPTMTHITCWCKSKIPCSHFQSMVVAKATITFNEVRHKERKKKGDSEDLIGPTIERICGHCGHNVMTYKTQQTRSADEGMTIFYFCLKCEQLEKEDS